MFFEEGGEEKGGRSDPDPRGGVGSERDVESSPTEPSLGSWAQQMLWRL